MTHSQEDGLVIQLKNTTTTLGDDMSSLQTAGAEAAEDK